MVDPNRKINRLSDHDISFLDLCEEKFENRFSETDEQFQAHCSKATAEPPVIPEFEQRNFNHGGGYNRNNRFNRPHRGGGGYNNHRNRGPYHRGGGGGGNYRGRGGGGGGTGGEHNFNYRYQ